MDVGVLGSRGVAGVGAMVKGKTSLENARSDRRSGRQGGGGRAESFDHTSEEGLTHELH